MTANHSESRRGFHCARWWLASVAVAIIALVVAVGSLRQPAGPAQGVVFQGKVQQASRPNFQRLRVATYNIHGGRDVRGHNSLGRIADCLRDVELVALNEVHGGFKGVHGNQAMILGEQLGLAWLFAPHERRWWRDHFGNGCLTSLPVIHWQRIPLAGPQRGLERNVVWVELRYQKLNLQVLVTHLDRKADRQTQLQAVARLFLAMSEPCLLLGDLNSGEDDAGIQELLTTASVRDPVKDCLGAATPRRIDWILSRGLRGVQADVCDHGASDHPCFRVELEAPSG